MWILTKHPSTSEDSGNPQFYLLAGRKYIAGRKDCDIVIPGDISISRRHATLEVSSINHADPELPVEGITVTDTSKVGVLINSKKITPNEATTLTDGDIISFGRAHLKYRLIHQRLAIVTSCINSSSSKSTVKSCIQKLGGFTLSNWSAKATHLVMEKVTFTIKVVCAIASGKPVVNIKYLEDLLDCCDQKTSLSLPQEKEYLPPISEKSLVNHDLLFQPNLARCSLMVGKLFIILVADQFKRIKDAILYAGGEAVLKDTKDGKLVKHVSSAQTIVMQVERKDEKSASKEQTAWINEIYAKLTQHNLRAIRESEVGLAILHASMESYCNPTLKAAPAVIGSSHTQVIADSICPTQLMTQVTTQQMTQPPIDNGDETQPLEGIPNDHSTQKDITNTSKTIPVDAKSPVKGDTTNSANSIPKRKRPTVSEEDTKAQSNLEQFFKKPKLIDKGDCHDGENVLEMLTSKSMDVDKLEKGDEKKSREKSDVLDLPTRKTLNTVKPDKSESINIINIDDDEDEDVFSFNYSKATMSLTTLGDNVGTTGYTNKVDETIPAISETLPNKSKGMKHTNVSTLQQINPESDVLFTTFSKNRVSDSCQSSSVSPLSRKSVAETCLPNVVMPSSKKPVTDISHEKTSVSESCPPILQKGSAKKSVSGRNISSQHNNHKTYNCDDDDDDDPFSFSVDVSAPILRSTAKDDLKKTENTEHVILASSKNVTKASKSNITETVKLVSDSDGSFYKSSTDDEKQHSRFLKAISSSQDSLCDDIYVSDGDGNLIPREKKSEEKKSVSSSEKLPDTPKDSTGRTCEQFDVDMRHNEENDADTSYLLDDEDVVSKEYSLQNQRNYVPLKGFISTLDMRPSIPLIKGEDHDIIGANTNLVQTTFVSLVVKQPKGKNVPRKTSDIPGSKLRNYKSFKKQYYAGMNKQVSTIGKNDLVADEGDNPARAALFADIREQDEKEAAENRRIDKMFEVMTRRKR